MDRRSLLKALAAAPLAATLPAWASPSRGEAHLLVLVFLYGGNDSFNTWVPYTNETYYRVRPTLAVPRDAVLKITDTHGFHPSLAGLMPAWQAKDLALLQGVGYANATQQHYRDIEIAFTGADEALIK
ncbi:MAG: twin-arginine translocation signal domain-containing protein, partial [Pseudomonadota bacterium]|nr:twin-arginine translocation signal domain-containing protein [Pseudomonadota bacterium]